MRSLAIRNMIWLLDSVGGSGTDAAAASLPELSRRWLARTAHTPRAEQRIESMIADVIEPRWNGVPVLGARVEDIGAWYGELARSSARRNDASGPGILRTLHAVLTNGLWSAQIGLLMADDPVEALATVVPVWTARSLHLPRVPGLHATSVGRAAGLATEEVLRATGRSGRAGSTAMTLPPIRGSWLVVTASHLALVPGVVPAELAWTVTREEVAGAKPAPRIHLLHRFRLCFADGSSAAFLVLKRPAVNLFTTVLG